MLDAAMRSEVGLMYPGGREQRQADIDAGATRSAAELAGDVAETAAGLEAAWASTTEEAWAGHGVTIAGEVALRDLPFIRWREVAVHHADLAIGYSWSDWDDQYVRLELTRLTMLWASRKPMGMTTLPSAALVVPPRHRVAWLLGRAEINGLDPAGIIG
jgi:maleylpyruvate isomerase